jgi:hypothetical protein
MALRSHIDAECTRVNMNAEMTLNWLRSQYC